MTKSLSKKDSNKTNGRLFTDNRLLKLVIVLSGVVMLLIIIDKIINL